MGRKYIRTSQTLQGKEASAFLTPSDISSKAENSHTHVTTEITGLESRLVALESAGPGGSYTDEQAQDAIGGILSNTGDVQFTYNDGVPSIVANLKSSVGLAGTPTAPTATPGTNTTQLATTAFVAAAVAALIGGAPGVLDTLDEIAAAINDDNNLYTTLTNLIAQKLVTANNLSDVPDKSIARTNLGLAIGTNVQAQNAQLAAIALLSTTAYGRGLLTLADADALTAGINVATAALKGLVPAPVTSTGRYLKDDLTWAAVVGGSDPWTYIRLGSDFVTSSATAVNVTGMSFTPSGTNKSIVIEGHFLFRTATATVGPRPGCSWPTGLSDGAADFYTTSAAATEVQQHGNINAAVLGPVGGLPNNTQSYGSSMVATMVIGAAPSGNFQIQLASETAGTNVTMKAGSWIRYRDVT